MSHRPRVRVALGLEQLAGTGQLGIFDFVHPLVANLRQPAFRFFS